MIDRSAIPRKVISEVCAFCFPWICLPAVVEQVPNRYPKARNMNTIKDDLIAEIYKRVADKILEPANAELLKKLIRQADNDNEAMSIAELGTTYKRTGLHFDKRLERMTDDICYFKKNEALSFHTDDGKPVHKLIIGDNYQALQNLMIQYKGKIDVIYIDPPYGKDNLGEFAQTNYENAITRDNLLSMLYPRLMLAKMLLSDSGVIFCSIDDRNQAYVKCLFDEVFGESNFIACICREAIKGGSKAKNIKRVHDYVLAYAKQLKDGGGDKDILIGEEFEENFRFDYEDDKGKYAKGRELNKWGAGSRREDSPSMWFPIEGPDGEEVFPIRNDGSEGRWRWGKKKLEKAVAEGEVIFERRADGSFVVYEKIRSDKIKNRQLVSILKDEFINAKGGEDLKDIFDTLMSPFDYAKPINLIEEIVKYWPTDDAIILDFFAGSGTTGHAVLDLNKEDDGERTFILCQLNEISDKCPNGIAIDLTAKRLKRIMTGECYDGTKDFKWIKENQPYGGNLDVYDLATVANFADTEGKTPFEVIDETLYGQEKFQTLREKVEWVCGNFSNAQKTVENDTEWQKRIVED